MSADGIGPKVCVCGGCGHRRVLKTPILADGRGPSCNKCGDIAWDIVADVPEWDWNYQIHRILSGMIESKTEEVIALRARQKGISAQMAAKEMLGYIECRNETGQELLTLIENTVNRIRRDIDKEGGEA